jgi:hypothetical protein
MAKERYVRLNLQSTDDTRLGTASAARLNFPCGHRRGDFDLVDPDFDVICPICFGHFFRYAFLPYFLFVALFMAIYFWRPVPLTELLFAVLSLFVLSYVSAVLRYRPLRLLLVLVILSATSLLVASHLVDDGIIRAPLKPLAVWSLFALVSVLVGSLFRGIVDAAALRNVHRASPIVFLLLVVGLTATILHIALHFVLLLIPSLQYSDIFNQALSFVTNIQNFRIALLLLAGGIALIWSGALSISAAREEESERSPGHSALAELRRILRFIRTVLAQLGTELFMVFIDSLRHFWVMTANVFRSLVLMIGASGLAISLHALAKDMSHIWDHESFLLPTKTALPSLMLDMLFVWLLTWGVIVVAFVRHKKNKQNGTFYQDFAHACLVLRFNLLRSTPIYWFYLSIVLFVAWFLIGSMRLVYTDLKGRPPVGVLFSCYALITLVLATGTALLRSFKRARKPV